MPVRQRAALVVILAAAYWAALFALTHLPISVPSPTRWFDKVEHAAAYGGLALLLCAAWSVFWRPGAAMAVAVVGVAAAYGAIDELTQMLVPRRSADPWDWAADVVGAVAGVAVFLLGWKLWTRGSAYQPEA